MEVDMTLLIIGLLGAETALVACFKGYRLSPASRRTIKSLLALVFGLAAMHSGPAQTGAAGAAAQGAPLLNGSSDMKTGSEMDTAVQAVIYGLPLVMMDLT